MLHLRMGYYFNLMPDMLDKSFSSDYKIPLRRSRKLEIMKNLEERTYKHLKVVSLYKSLARVESAGTKDLEIILAI